jgi:septin family protein
MLEGISSLVAVVPVIAKADTHTAPELEAYRKEVLEVSASLHPHEG